MESGQYLSYIGSDQRARYVLKHRNMLVMSDVVQAHLNVCKHTILWLAQTHISTQWFRSEKSQYLLRTLWSFLNTQHDQSTQTSMQACYFLVYMGNIIAIFGWICDIKVSVESGEHAGVV